MQTGEWHRTPRHRIDRRQHRQVLQCGCHKARKRVGSEHDVRVEEKQLRGGTLYGTRVVDERLTLCSNCMQIVSPTRLDGILLYM
jgi:hypothetical protein